MYCRFGNPAVLDGVEARVVTLSISALPRQAAEEQPCPQLDASGLQSIMIPAAVSSIAIGPIVVTADTVANNGQYQLRIRVDGVPQPLEVPFTFTDASGWTQEVAAAQEKTVGAQRKHNGLTMASCNNRKCTQKLEKDVNDALCEAQRQLRNVVNINNWPQARADCEAALQQLPPSRPVRLAEPLLHEGQKAALRRVPGVIGFAHELLTVADVDQARLLSWFAQNSMWDLFLDSWDPRDHVRHLWAQWGLMDSARLTLVLLSSPDNVQHSLPHEGQLLLLWQLPTCAQREIWHRQDYQADQHMVVLSASISSHI